VLSLWLLGVTVITLLRRSDPAGWAFLLLATSGYAPQLSTQLLAELIALWLLADTITTRGRDTEPSTLSRRSLSPWTWRGFSRTI
jgi:hypothetical protein